MPLPDLRIEPLLPADTRRIEQAARVLVAAFAEGWPSAWPDLESARAEVAEVLAPDCLCRAAFIGDDLAGWVGGIPDYDGRVWELHPLAVDPAWQGRGIGRALVEDLCGQAAQRGALTVLLGTDDETGMTTLTGADLYADPWQHIRAIRNLRRHPYEFYQKLGFTIVGVVPDANGPGRPDILMARRVEGYNKG